MNGRGLVAITVLAAWGAGVATFIQREANRSPRERLAEAAMRVAPGAHYFLVEVGGRHAGFASVTIDTIPEGLQITDYSVRDTVAGADTGRVVTRVATHLSRGLWMRGIDVAGSRGPSDGARARVIDDSTLEVVAGSAGDTVRHRFTGPLLIPSLVPLAVALGERPEPGQRHEFDVFDPAQLGVRRLRTRVASESLFVVVDSAIFSAPAARWLGAHADTVRGWHLVEDHPGGIDVWVDELGREIQSRASDAVSRRRTAYEVAFENWRTAAAGTERATTDETAPTVERAIAALRGAPAVDTLVVRVSGLELSRLSADSRGQARTGDTVRVARLAIPKVASGYWLPSARSVRRPFWRDLQVAPWIETDDPAIVARATRIRQREGDPVVVAKRLVAWVADSVRLEPTYTPPSAVAALRSLAGDVEHHASLFIALARASGIPSRAVTGVIVRDSLVMTHAWAEAWLGQQWIPVDPSLGQFPADAGRLRLTVGGIGARAELDRLIARAELRVVRSHRAPSSDSLIGRGARGARRGPAPFPVNTPIAERQ